MELFHNLYTCFKCDKFSSRLSLGIGFVIALIFPYLFAEWLLSVAKVIVVVRKFLKWSFQT